MPKREDMERRSYTFEIRREERAEGSSTLSGRAIVYNSATDICGWFREIIEPGALDGANLRDVPLLVNHDDQSLRLTSRAISLVTSAIIRRVGVVQGLRVVRSSGRMGRW